MEVKTEDKTEETLIKRCKEKNMKNGGMLSLGSLKEAWISSKLLRRYKKENTTVICSILKHQAGLV